MGKAAGLIGGGIALGIFLTMMAAKTMSALLFGVTASDAGALAGAVCALAIVSLLAAAVPAALADAATRAALQSATDAAVLPAECLEVPAGEVIPVQPGTGVVADLARRVPVGQGRQVPVPVPGRRRADQVLVGPGRATRDPPVEVLHIEAVLVGEPVELVRVELAVPGVGTADPVQRQHRLGTEVEQSRGDPQPVAERRGTQVEAPAADGGVAEKPEAGDAGHDGQHRQMDMQCAGDPEEPAEAKPRADQSDRHTHRGNRDRDEK